jgi:hypothetical protein
MELADGEIEDEGGLLDIVNIHLAPRKE